MHQNDQKLLCEKRTHGLTEDEKSRGSLAREHYTCMIQLHYLCPKSGDYYDRNESFEPPNDVVIVVHGWPIRPCCAIETIFTQSSFRPKREHIKVVCRGGGGSFPSLARVLRESSMIDSPPAIFCLFVLSGDELAHTSCTF